MEALLPSIAVYLLVLTRVTAFIITVPLFSYRAIPSTHRIIFAALLSWMMVYTIDAPELQIDGLYILLVIKEATTGLFIGIIAYIVISAIQVAGGFIDFQMGFAIANVIDPQTGAQSPLLGQFFNVLAMLLLLTLNGHHMLLDGIFIVIALYPSICFGRLSGVNVSSSSSLRHLLHHLQSHFKCQFQSSQPYF